MRLRMGTVEMELDDDIAAAMVEQQRADKHELQRVAATIAALPIDQQDDAWATLQALAQDRTDRAMARSIAVAEAEGNHELAAAFREQWEQRKRERLELRQPRVAH